MCVHVFSRRRLWNHDGWRGEEQRARDCVHQDSARLHPSPANAAAAALRLWDALLTSQWILGDLSYRFSEFTPRMCAAHTHICVLMFIFYLPLSEVRSLPLLPSFLSFSLSFIHPPILSSLSPFFPSLLPYPLLSPFLICLPAFSDMSCLEAAPRPCSFPGSLVI